MKIKKASLGLAIGFGADKLLRKSEGARKILGSGMFGLTGLGASKYYKDKAKEEPKKEEEIKTLRGGGIAIKGTKFKGVF